MVANDATTTAVKVTYIIIIPFIDKFNLTSETKKILNGQSWA